MNIYEGYQKKLVSAEEAVKLVKDGDWVDYSQTCSFPERGTEGHQGPQRHRHEAHSGGGAGSGA